MEPGCIGKSNTNNLPAPTDLIENPYGKKNIFKEATQKSARVVVGGIAVELRPREPIFGKCSHLREKGGVLTKNWLMGNSLSRTLARAQVVLFPRAILRSASPAPTLYRQQTVCQNSIMRQSYGHRRIFSKIQFIIFPQIWPYPRQNPM